MPRFARRRILAVFAAVGALAARARADVIPFFRAKRPEAMVDEGEVRSLLGQQAAEWTAGDIDGFCSHYAEGAVFVSPAGLTRGRAAVLERYKKKYGASKETMGALSLDLLDVTAGRTVASVAMRWKLVWPPQLKKADAEGYSVIGLLKIDGAWMIVHDASF